MTRAFLKDPLPGGVFESCVDLARRSPSAGKSQGWNLLVWENHDTAHYWDIAFPAANREGFAFPGLFDAPLIALVLADERAYLDRYSEPDKARQSLGGSAGEWVAPYWIIDAAFATMTLLDALREAGLGALFFAHANEEALRAEFGVPGSVHVLGVIAAGYPDGSRPSAGRSAARPRRSAGEIIHRGRW